MEAKTQEGGEGVIEDQAEPYTEGAPTIIHVIYAF
jgi:hypothetical protein